MQFTREGYGLGWYVGHYDGDVLLHHFGGFSGFHAHVSFMPERKIGVVALANEIGFGGFLAELVARYAYDLLRGQPDVDQKYEADLEEYAANARNGRQRIAADRATRAARPRFPARPLTDFAGTYVNPHYGTIVFAIRGDLLATMGPQWSRVEAFDPPRNDFLRVELLGGGSVVRFDFEKGTPAHALTMSGITFERREP